jgi:hypothetical protein
MPQEHTNFNGLNGRILVDNAYNTDLLSLKKIDRSIDGSKNNVANPDWGKRGIILDRKVPELSQAEMDKKFLLNPRVISNFIAK